MDVYVFEVEDIDSDWWVSEVAVVAGSRQEAYRRLREAGLHKKQIENSGLPVRVEAVGGWALLADHPGAVVRRQGDCDGWGPWERVADGMSLDWRVSGKGRRGRPGR